MNYSITTEGRDLRILPPKPRSHVIVCARCKKRVFTLLVNARFCKRCLRDSSWGGGRDFVFRR